MAIDDIYDEHEQGERVRAWLRRNSLGLLGGIALGLALIFGWQFWQKHQTNQRVEAGNRYQAVVNAVAAGDLEQAQARAAELSGATYPVLAALEIAKAQLTSGDTEAAIATLRAAPTADPALEPIRRHRLALLLIDAGEAGEAVGLLDGSRDPAALETLGDAHFALGERDAAAQAYGSALEQLDADAPQRRLVELKLIDAGGTPPQSGTI